MDVTARRREMKKKDDRYQHRVGVTNCCLQFVFFTFHNVSESQSDIFWGIFSDICWKAMTVFQLDSFSCDI